MSVISSTKEVLIHSLETFDRVYNKRNAEEAPHVSYGRGVELASGLGLWFVAFTFIQSSLYSGIEVLDIYSFLWGWIAFSLGFCQIAYHKVAQRVIFTFFGSVAWMALAIYSFMEVGDWNIATAACLPLAVFNFYVHGFVFNENVSKNKH